jgi:S-adenosylmethionine:tRNA ribosyltransferase-isomerase
MRAVESSVSSHGTLNPFDGWTKNLFSLLMNLQFLLYDYKLSYTKSTLLMMVSAFVDMI